MDCVQTSYTISDTNPSGQFIGFDLLDSIEKTPLVSSEDSLRERVSQIKMLLNGDSLFFTRPGDHSLLHDRLMEITDTARTSPELRGIWIAFLKAMQGLTVYYPDRVQRVSLDVHSELRRLVSSHVNEVAVSVLDASATADDKENIWTIANESFGTYEVPDRESFEQWYLSKEQTCLTARDEKTQSIVGLVLFEMREGHCWVNIVARRAKEAKRGIATKLLTELFDKYAPKAIPISLCVREGNVNAQALYEKFGFVKTGEYRTPGRACPKERSCVMVRN